MMIGKLETSYNKRSGYTKVCVISRLSEMIFIHDNMEDTLQILDYIKWVSKKTDFSLSLQNLDYDSKPILTLHSEYKSEQDKYCLVYRDWDGGKVTTDHGKVITMKEFERLFFSNLDTLKNIAMGAA